MTKFNQLFLIIIIFFLTGCTGQKGNESLKGIGQQFFPSLDSPIPVNPNVVEGKLDNGIKYLILKNGKPENRAELRLVVNVGSVLEEDDQQGLAHFVEHMAFNGTKNFAKQEIVDYLESIGMRFGADINAYTSFDETVYMLKVPTDSAEMVEQGFLILEDWASGVSFEDEEIDKERGVVIEEWRLRRGAEARMFDKQLPVLFKDSRYAVRLPIGQKAVLDSFSYDAAKRFYKEWYRPELMAVIAVGDFDVEWIEGLIKEHFNRIPASENPRDREVYGVPDHKETLVSIASDKEATGSRISIYYKQDTKNENSHGAYREGIIKSIYNAMLNDRLAEITTKLNAPFLYGFSAQGRFVREKEVYLLTSGVQDNGIERGLEALLTEAERVALHGFTSAELERQKINQLKSMEKAYNERDKTNSGSYASEYIRHFLVDEPIPGIIYEFELYKMYMPTITLDEINSLARTWLSDENRVILANLPIKDSIVEPTDASLLAVFDIVKSLTIEPYEESVPDLPLVADIPAPSAVTSESYIEVLDIHEFILANGIRVLMKKTDFKNDEILMTSFSAGGRSHLVRDEYVPGKISASVINESGFGAFNKIALEKKLAGKIVGVSPYIGSVKEGISGSSTPEDIETMFQLIHLVFTAPRKDSTAYLALKERINGFVLNRSASPNVAFRDTISALMSRNHPRYRPWSTELVEEFDLNKSYNIFRNAFADAGDFTFIFIGNIEPAVIKKLSRIYLGNLPADAEHLSFKDDGVDPPEGVIKKKVFKGQEPKSNTQIIFTGDFEWNRQNRYNINSMVHSLRIKLREVLREELGGTYGVRVSAILQEFPDEEYQIRISFGSDPDRVAELTETVFTQIDSLRNFGTTDKNLVKIKEIQRRTLETSLKENSFWLNTIESYVWHKQDFADVMKFDELVEALSLETIRKTAHMYFDMNNYVQVSLYPEGFVE